jgi:hypothetical protein
MGGRNVKAPIFLLLLSPQICSVDFVTGGRFILHLLKGLFHEIETSCMWCGSIDLYLERCRRGFIIFFSCYVDLYF